MQQRKSFVSLVKMAPASKPLLLLALVVPFAAASAIPPPPPPPPWQAPELQRRYDRIMAETAALTRRISERLAVIGSAVERTSRGSAVQADWDRLRVAINAFQNDREEMHRLIDQMRALALEPELRRESNERSLVLHRVEMMTLALCNRQRSYTDFLERIVERLMPSRLPARP